MLYIFSVFYCPNGQPGRVSQFLKYFTQFASHIEDTLPWCRRNTHTQIHTVDIQKNMSEKEIVVQFNSEFLIIHGRLSVHITFRRQSYSTSGKALYNLNMFPTSSRCLWMPVTCSIFFFFFLKTQKNATLIPSGPGLHDACVCSA